MSENGGNDRRRKQTSCGCGESSGGVRNLIDSIFQLSWRVPLSTAEQLTKLLSRPLSSALEQRGGTLGRVASAANEQVDGLFQAAGHAASSIQQQSVDLFWEALTLRPVREALETNIPFLAPSPEPGSQKQPELAYLKAVSDAAPAGDPLCILVLGVLYVNLGRASEGIRVFEGYLERRADMELWQQGVYTSTLALLEAGAAQTTPAWKLPTLLGHAQTALARASQAKALTETLPDFDAHLAKLVARWVSGLLNAQLPAPLGNKDVALEDLEWVERTVTRDVETESAAFMFLREAYYHLGRLAEQRGDETAAKAYLELSTYPDLGTKDTILATLFSGDPAGLRDGIKHVMVSGGGSVFTVSGHDMSEFNFVISKDGKHLIAIDSGTRWQRAQAAYRYLEGYLKSQGRVPPPLTTAIFTHAHWDHIGGYSAFRDLHPGIQFYSRSNYREEQQAVVAMTPPYEWFLSEEYDVGKVADFRPDVVIAPGSDLEREGLVIGGTRFDLWAPPGGGGETPDGLFLHLPEEGVIFAGDFIVPWIGTPFTHEGDLDSLLRTIDWIVEKKPEIVLHGHEALTVFFKHWPALARFRPHLAWLGDETKRLISQHLTLAEIQDRNLYPQALLAPDQADVQLPYLLIRESLINRLYKQRTGYWGPKLENVGWLSPEALGSALTCYLELPPDRIVDAVARMIRNGDHELAARIADWALTQHPEDAGLRGVRAAAYRKLKEKWQFLNVFKFVMFSEVIGDPTYQMPLGEEPQGYVERSGRGAGGTAPAPSPGGGSDFDLGFSNASFAGPYEFTIKVGFQDVVGFGTVRSDGRGNFGGTQELNLGNGQPLLEQKAAGTYQVYPDGTGVAHLTLTQPDGTEVPATFDYVVLQAEQRGPVKLATELQGVSRDPAVDPATGRPFDPPQLAVTLFKSVGDR